MKNKFTSWSYHPSYFFFNDTATPEIYTLSLHDALPISLDVRGHGETERVHAAIGMGPAIGEGRRIQGPEERSEEHTSELQSRRDLVCRLLLEKKKQVC